MHASLHDFSLDAFVKNKTPCLNKETDSYAHLKEKIEAINVENTEMITARTTDSLKSLDTGTSNMESTH